MKKILGLLLLVVVWSAMISVILSPMLREQLRFQVKKALRLLPCQQPIHYRVDAVDPRFHVSREQFLANIQHATQVWSTVEGKQLFVYDEKGPLSINLIYDERQSLDSKIVQMQNSLDSQNSTIQPKIAEYQRLVAAFKPRLAAFNQKVQSINQNGGAKPDEYEQLIRERNALQAQANQINQLAHQLNQSTVAFNGQVNVLNKEIDTFNTALTQKPEEGVYIPENNKIVIYFHINDNEFVHTIAHELGHALGLDHVTDPKAIMYAMTNQNITPTTADVSALKALCAAGQ